jgi:asparagine synthase (glutamine-hydrolysing)
MCGLYASIGLIPEKFRLDRVAHRGPDGEGWAVYDTPAGPLAFGHRRLAIIDLDPRAAQPMVSSDQRYAMIFNGEIYNYIELKSELAALGESFTTSSDAEVLLVALKVWGHAALPKLRGMFAFLLYDRAKQTLLVARDAFGIKPIYYVQTNHGIAFGSEPKQLYDMSGVSRTLNMARTWDFIVSQTSEHTSETLFEGVSHLRPGCLLEIDVSQPLGAAKITPKTWFVRPRIASLDLSLSDAAAEFKRLLDRSVELHLRADVPVGSCLSGGLDSSSIVGLASKQRGLSDPISTFTAIFPGQSVDEARYAQAVVARNKAQPTYIQISQDDLSEAVRDVVWHQDEPFGSTSILAQWFVFKAIGQSGIKVVLDGQGADEQMAGYHGLFNFHHASLFKRRQFGPLISAMIARKFDQGAPISPAFGAVMRRISNRLGLSLKQDQAQAGPDIFASGTLREFVPETGSTLNEILARDDLPALDTLAELCLAMTVSSNLPMLLRFEDRNSMAHSVEARVPFVETDLIAFTLGLGEHHKMVGAKNKAVLRRAMADMLPASVLDRKDKLGFSTPESDWLRGGLRHTVETGIALARDRFPALLDWQAGEKLVELAMKDGATADPQIWRLANLGHWAERFDVT